MNAYDQNVAGLERAWADRIDSFARQAVRELRAAARDELGLIQLEASEIVAARLLDSEQWADVKATDISDIAYQAAGRVLAWS